MRSVMTEQNKIIGTFIEPIGSAAATKNSKVVSMRGWSHATIILSVGIQAGAFTAILYECDDFTPSNATAIAARIAAEATADGDTLGALAALAATGQATAATNNIFYVIEVDAEDLSEGYPNIQLRLSDLDNTTYVSAVCILSGGGGQCATVATEIA